MAVFFKFDQKIAWKFSKIETANINSYLFNFR